MTRLATRILSLGQQNKSRPQSPAEQRRDGECLAAKYGMTFDEAVAKHGTFGAFCCWVLMQVGLDKSDAPDSGLSSMDQYMRMIRR